MRPVREQLKPPEAEQKAHLEYLHEVPAVMQASHNAAGSSLSHSPQHGPADGWEMGVLRGMHSRFLLLQIIAVFYWDPQWGAAQCTYGLYVSISPKGVHKRVVEAVSTTTPLQDDPKHLVVEIEGLQNMLHAGGYYGQLKVGILREIEPSSARLLTNSGLKAWLSYCF